MPLLFRVELQTHPDEGHLMLVAALSWGQEAVSRCGPNLASASLGDLCTWDSTPDPEPVTFLAGSALNWGSGRRH